MKINRNGVVMVMEGNNGKVVVVMMKGKQYKL